MKIDHEMVTAMFLVFYCLSMLVLLLKCPSFSVLLFGGIITVPFTLGGVCFLSMVTAATFNIVNGFAGFIIGCIFYIGSIVFIVILRLVNGFVGGICQSTAGLDAWWIIVLFLYYNANFVTLL